MRTPETPPLSRRHLVGYFLDGATPRENWRVGMEFEKMGRRTSDGAPIPYEDSGPSVRSVLEWFLARRGGDPVFEAHHLIGIDGPWGALSLEPGGQIEWSSRPRATLDELERDLDEHVALLSEIGERLGVSWLDVAVDPTLPLSEMLWMPKARYKIMRSYFERRGKLAHRMMTQTASIQCAFDYADAADWARKFVVAARLAPLATAMFANSPRVDGASSGHCSYRSTIWSETDSDRCGLPPVVFRPDFDLDAWVDWVINVPTLFLHRARGLVPSSGVRFHELLERTGCDAIGPVDWETHLSSIFTDVRSYTYVEVRTADLLPDPLALSVPALWTGILYSDEALAKAHDLSTPFGDHDSWTRAMRIAGRDGLDAVIDGQSLRDLAQRTLGIAARGLGTLPGTIGAARSLERLAVHHQLDVPA